MSREQVCHLETLLLYDRRVVVRSWRRGKARPASDVPPTINLDPVHNVSKYE